MPTSLNDNYVTDGVAVIWYSLLFGLAGRLRHPGSAVVGNELRRGLGLYFHALGGDLKRTIPESGERENAVKFTTHGGLDLQAWTDGDTLHLPRRINRFQTRELNRELFYWLAGILALDEPHNDFSHLPPGVRHLLQGVATSARLLKAFPNLKARHDRLCAEELRQRRLAYADPSGNTRNPALVLESAIRYELGSGKPYLEPSLEELVSNARAGVKIPAGTPWHGRTVPFLPVPLWPYRSASVPKVRLPWFKTARTPKADQDLESTRTAKFDATLEVEQADDRAAINDHYLYPEWNTFEREYRSKWCRLIEQPPKGGYSAELDSGFKVVVDQVRRRYLLLRQEPKWKRFLEYGDDIDIDAFVSAAGDRRGCGAQNARYYREKERLNRDISVAILMDASRSTQVRLGNVRVIEVAKQSLAVLAEVLDLAGDDFALYSFSSDSRLRVRCDRIKTFDQLYGDQVQRNILEVKPQNYTRLGAAVRHVGARLGTRKGQQKLLLILTDGKPHDPTDRYEGKYALEDARKAIIEQRAKGMECFGLTIDQAGLRYLNRLFGPGHYAVYSHLNALPQILPNLYARLTNLRLA